MSLEIEMQFLTSPWRNEALRQAESVTKNCRTKSIDNEKNKTI